MDRDDTGSPGDESFARRFRKYFFSTISPPSAEYTGAVAYEDLTQIRRRSTILPVSRSE